MFQFSKQLSGRFLMYWYHISWLMTTEKRYFTRSSGPVLSGGAIPGGGFLENEKYLKTMNMIQPFEINAYLGQCTVTILE